MPSYFMLFEEQQTRDKVGEVLSNFWVVMKRRAVWQVMLYTMISSITFNVFIAAKQNANYVWLELSTAQNQIINIVEAFMFMVGLSMVRQWGLNYSWRKLIWIGSVRRIVLFLFESSTQIKIMFDSRTISIIPLDSCDRIQSSLPSYRVRRGQKSLVLRLYGCKRYLHVHPELHGVRFCYCRSQ